MFKNLPMKEKLFSEKNIFLAIYSVESYISNKELLSIDDKKNLIRLRDKFDWEFIQKWIERVKERLDKIINNGSYLKTRVFFKPKKYEEEVIFRPLHSANLLDQITAVAMLNILIYDFDDENKISMSNLSRLIPHNFYGNRVAYEPEKLFKPWQEQYKKYTSKANECYRKYHENLEYKWEVNLDLKNFFPSINPISLINFIDQQMPVEYSAEERELVNKLLEKLIFVELEQMTLEDMRRYTGSMNIEESRFAIGLPQGLPQSYFLANLFMVNLQEIYKEVIPGEMLFYVDDSAIFTNEVKNVDDFAEKIVLINNKIKEWMNELYMSTNKYLSNEVLEFVKEKQELFQVTIHKPGEKSTISNIADSKEGEAYIHCIGRETSKTAFEMNTSYSDEESKILLNKTDAILQVIELEMSKTDEKLASDNIDEDEKKYTVSYKKKLVRYKKFFKYRNKDLDYRKNTSITSIKEELLEDLEFLKNKNKKDGLEEFFEKYNEDILGTNIGFVLKAMKESDEDLTKITEKIKELNKCLFGKMNKSSSYLYTAYKEYIENIDTEKIDNLNMKINSYSKLNVEIRRKKKYINKKTDEVCLKWAIQLLDSIDNQFSIVEHTEEEFAEAASLVTSNSDTLQRMLLNALFSCLLKIEISDEVVLQKTNNRKITYFELRLLELLRNKHFSIKRFAEIKNDLKKDEYQYSIDYSIMQVLSIFRTFVSEPGNIDNLILVHKYTCDIWKNGSKHLYFYTLHNQEHAVDLILNSIKILHAIDYIDISKNDYYVLFIACYLHDISMVTLPSLDAIQSGGYENDKIYSDFVKDIRNQMENSNLAKKEILKLLKDYYMRIDSFYEALVRNSHARDSAKEIRARSELGFIDAGIREIVAEVSEAHGYNISEVYKVKSKASSKLWSLKFTKIILRLADLLDMSNYRVSRLILEHNLDNMGNTSRFHWLSHLVTCGYQIETQYFLDNDKKEHFLERQSIIEKMILTVKVNMPQMTGEEGDGCKNMKLDCVNGTTVILKCGEACNGNQCNFLCKWFSKKNEYLFMELAALQEYLNSLPDNYFKSLIEVRVESNSKNSLNPKQFTLLKKYVEEN